jgi:ribose-phosphate pyrophosphokinase
MSEISEAIRQQINPMKIFGLDGTKPYAERVAQHLDTQLTPHEEKVFDDEEPYLKSSSSKDGNVRGHDCFVIHSLYSDKTQSVSDKFMSLALMCGALQGSKAHEVIGVIPYPAWNRQGRKVVSRDGVATLITHSMLMAAGLDHALYIDPHDLPATQNSYDVRHVPDVLECTKLFASWVAEELRKASGLPNLNPRQSYQQNVKTKLKKRLVVLAPDPGAYVRCVKFAEVLAYMLGYKESEIIDVAVFPKVRKNGKVDMNREISITGNVNESWVIVYDDMFNTFSTALRANNQVVKEGGEMFAIAGPHGIFAGEANEQMRLVSPDVRIAVSDTIEPWRLEEDNRNRLHVIDTTKLVADAIKRIHSKTGSISQLLS